MSVLEGLWGKNTDKNTSREGASTLKAFSLRIFFEVGSGPRGGDGHPENV